MLSIALHEIPVELIPEEPRLGRSCVPIPRSRFRALESSGPAILGRSCESAAVQEFLASVLSELRSLFRLPEGYSCEVAAGTPTEIFRSLAAAGWYDHLNVLGQGPRSDMWRSVMDSPVQSNSNRETFNPVPGMAVVAGEYATWMESVEYAAPAVWVTADLSEQSGVVTGDVFSGIDFGLLCPSTLFGINQGCTIIVMSPRANARIKSGLWRSPVSTTDLMMLAHAVRRFTEDDLSMLEDEIVSRHHLVATWADEREWVICAPRPRGGGLGVCLFTILDPRFIEQIGIFLEDHHIAYGITDNQVPGSLHIGLYPTLDAADIERMLGLLDFLVMKSTFAEFQVTE